MCGRVGLGLGGRRGRGMRSHADPASTTGRAYIIHSHKRTQTFALVSEMDKCLISLIARSSSVCRDDSMFLLLLSSTLSTISRKHS